MPSECEYGCDSTDRAPAGRSVGWTRYIAICLLTLGQVAATGHAQPIGRKATTVSALLFHPSFFHGQRVTVRGTLRDETDDIWLEGADDAIRLLGGLESQGASGPDGLVELRGICWDVGRLQSDDPRLAGYDLDPLIDDLDDRAWPRPGEVLALASASTVSFSRSSAQTIRSVALEPTLYTDREVTLTGRFRGRNLYGDLPQAPRLSRWDFVLQSSDAAIWVTGREPKGDGFRLGLTARVDTGRWLEVTGTVQRGQGLLWVEATELDAVDPPAEPTTTASQEPPRVLSPPPEVIFSAPVQDDVGVAVDDSVRIQFSEDMDGASFERHVRASYIGDPTPLPITTRYRPGNRVLEIVFVEPLEPFRTVQVHLLEGIVSIDSQALMPWTLTYSVGD